MNEREYLIQQAIGQFNSQFGNRITMEDVEIRSLPARVHFDRSYEVYTRRMDDHLRMHMHLVFGNVDALGAYRLETDTTQVVGGLGDEVYVAVGQIAGYHVTTGEFKFRYIAGNDEDDLILLLEDGTPMLQENGLPITLESAPD